MSSPLLVDVADYASVALAVPAEEVGKWSIETVDDAFDSPTTAGLYRVRGANWSMFLKVVQSYRHWPLFHVLPAEWIEHLPVDEAWRYEADIVARPPERQADTSRCAPGRGAQETG